MLRGCRVTNRLESRWFESGERCWGGGRVRGGGEGVEGTCQYASAMWLSDMKALIMVRPYRAFIVRG